MFLGYIGIGVVIGSILVYFLARYTYLQSKADGDFRHAHIKIRECAEEIAFHGRNGFAREKLVVSARFGTALDAAWGVYKMSAALLGMHKFRFRDIP